MSAADPEILEASAEGLSSALHLVMNIEFTPLSQRVFRQPKD